MSHTEGDGSLLAQNANGRAFPSYLCAIHGRRSFAKHCHETQLQNFLAGKISLDKLKKIEVAANGHRLTAVNDIFIHNAEQASALRYQVWIDDELLCERNCRRCCRAFQRTRSSAYYRSITHSVFGSGSDWHSATAWNSSIIW